MSYVTIVSDRDRYGNAVLLRETPHDTAESAEHDASWARYCGMQASVETRGGVSDV